MKQPHVPFLSGRGARRFPAGIALFAAALAGLISAGSVSAQADWPGRYRLDEGHEAAGELLLTADGHFRYALAVGALDEQAKGRWERAEARACLFTEPKPKPAEFAKAPPVAVDGAVPTLLVTWPNGRGIAGVDFVLGFDRGDPVDGYTQEYGWTLPENDTRMPRWAEFREPIHSTASPRYTLTDADHGKLHVTLVPNDLGVVDFAGACLEQQPGYVILHRREGPMRFVRARE